VQDGESLPVIPVFTSVLHCAMPCGVECVPCHISNFLLVLSDGFNQV